jgi:ABC-type polysaccharide/polyol phosphate export permease
MLLVPVLLLIQVLLIGGVLMFASAFNVFYRDIRFVVPLLIQIWFYATPIIYPLDIVPESLRFFYMINPMAGLIESYRAVILRGEWPNWTYLALAAAISLILFSTGYIYFKKVEWQFADII